MNFFDHIPPVPPAAEFAADAGSVLSCWREASAASWTEHKVVSELRASVSVVRPLARGLSAAFAGDTAGKIGAALRTEHEVRIATDSLATDLLGSALLLDALLGDAAAQMTLDHLRGRRGLPQIAWRHLVRRARCGARPDSAVPIVAEV